MLSNRERRWRRIQRLWASGHTQADIANRLGLDPARVGAEIAKMRAAGIQLDRRAEIDAEAMQARRERIAVLWAQEATQREIAHELGITVAALAAAMARMRHNGWDLPLRRERTPRKAPLRDRIAGLWVKGHTIAEIADQTGRTTSQVASELAWMRREAGRDIPARHDGRTAAARRNRVAKLYRDGRPLAEIAAEIGSTVGSIATTVSDMRQAGVDLPRRAAP